MTDGKEVERLMRIAESHARAALAKPEAQRDSHLAYCRLNWKRYAASLNKSPLACERFADALDRATRELMAMLEANGGASLAGAAATSPGPVAEENGTDAALAEDDALWASHDLGYDLETLRTAAAAEAAEAAVAAEPATTVQVEGEAPEGGAAPQPEPLPPPPDSAEIQRAEAEDRESARYGFGVSRRAEPTKVVPIRPADQDLQRKVQAVLHAHRQATKPADDDER